MSHLTAGVSFVPQPRTTFDFRISGLSKESFTTAKVGDVLCSPSFTALGSEWEVHVYLGGDDDEQANYVSVFLGLVASDRKEVNATFALCIPGVRITGHATFGPDLCGQARFLPHSALLAAPYKYFPGGVMTVTATVQLTQAKRHVEETRAVSVVTSPAVTIISEWASLLQSGADADVTLCCGGERIPAHSLVLCLRSPVFRALPRGPLAADASSVPVPETIKPAILRRLLLFIYTDALEPLSAEEAQHLLAAADHYDLKRLVALCAEALALKLSVDNAAYTLTLAAQHGAEGLKERALRFVVDNVAGVVALPGWAHLKASRPELLEAALLMCAGAFSVGK